MSDLQFEYRVYVRWLGEHMIAQIEQDLADLAAKNWRIISSTTRDNDEIVYTLERVKKEGRGKDD